MLVIAFLIITASYLLGSFPFGYLIAKSRGVDIRRHGSGNIGATNVSRVLGRTWGILVFLLDAAKGYGAVPLAVWMNHALPASLQHWGGFYGYHGYLIENQPILAKILAAIWVIIGHNFPIWLRFKGGKGVATSAGAMFALLAPAVICALAVWLLLFYSTRYVSVASICATLMLPVGAFFFGDPQERGALLCLTLVICLLVIWRHRANIRRLIEGHEHRFEKGHPHPHQHQ